MGQRANAVADRFHQTRETTLTTLDGYSPEQMQARCAAEQCTVAALASHMAGVQKVVSGWIETAAQGGSLPALTMDDINHINHEQFARNAGRDKDELLQELRSSGERAEQTLRQLSDADLDRKVQFSLFGGEATPQLLAEQALIGHIESHLKSIIAAGAAE